MYNKTVCIDENADSYVRGIPLPTESNEETIPQIISQIVELSNTCKGNAHDIERVLFGPTPENCGSSENSIDCLNDAIKQVRSILSSTRIILENINRKL